MMVRPQPAPTPFAHQTTANISSSVSSMPAFVSCVPFPKDALIIPSPTIRTYPSSPPDTPEASPTWPRPHPHHQFCHKHHPMCTALHFARLYRQIQVRSRLLSSLFIPSDADLLP